MILTQGLLNAHFNGALTEEELGAIIGHEVGHIKHHDGLRGSVAYAWISIFSAGGEIAKQLGSNLIAEAGEESSFANLVWKIGGLTVVCFGLFAKVLAKIASVLYFYLSRKQEHDADDLGGQLTHPRTMATALQKIEDLNRNLAQEQLKELPFPDLWQVKPRKLSIVDRLWTTHPPTEERRTRLENLAQFV